MRRRLLARRPSPAMVVAVVALISSLTGGAVAATLITSSDIAKNAVKSKHIKNKGVKGKDLKGNAVKSKHVRDGSLLSDDFAAGQLPAGEVGPQGPAGPAGAGPKGDKGDKGDPGDTGPAGATNVTERVGTEVAVPAGTLRTATASCLPGERAVAGGWQFVSGQVDPIVYQSRATGNPPTGWTLNIWKPAGASATLAATVMCAAP